MCHAPRCRAPQRRFISIFAGTLMAFGLVAGSCSPRPGSESPGAAADAPPASNSASASEAAASGAAPTLAEARDEQARVAAAGLSDQIGVPVEAMSGAAPAWFVRAVQDETGAEGYRVAISDDRDLAGAYEKAMRRVATEVGPMTVARDLRPDRVAYTRLPQGWFTVWVRVPAGLQAQAPAAPLQTPAPSEPAVAPTLPVPSAPPAPQPPPSGAAAAPVWWHDEPREENGRVIVCVAGEASEVREALRSTVRAGREKLRSIIGEEPRDVITLKATSAPIGEGAVRAYVQMSCPGSL